MKRSIYDKQGPSGFEVAMVVFAVAVTVAVVGGMLFGLLSR